MALGNRSNLQFFDRKRSKKQIIQVTVQTKKYYTFAIYNAIISEYVLLKTYTIKTLTMSICIDRKKQYSLHLQFFCCNLSISKFHVFYKIASCQFCSEKLFRYLHEANTLKVFVILFKLLLLIQNVCCEYNELSSKYIPWLQQCKPKQ